MLSDYRRIKRAQVKAQKRREDMKRLLAFLYRAGIRLREQIPEDDALHELIAESKRRERNV